MNCLSRVLPPVAPRRAPQTRRNGFTLIELLVVIGIIALLVSILLPTIGKVRVQAQIARTTSILQGMAAAIERYHLEQGSYPGLFSNADITSGKTLTGVGGNITMTENMILSMCGGADPGVAATPAKPPNYIESRVGKGARTFNINANRRVVMDVYLDGTPGVRMAPQAAGSWATTGITGKTDTIIPEYLDNFGDPRPILYLRAVSGNPGISAADETKQYNYSHLLPYQVKPTVSAANALGDFDWVGLPGNSPPVPPDFKSWDSYLTAPNTSGVVRGANTFLLIDAGPDGIFGTKDDIFYGGN